MKYLYIKGFGDLEHTDTPPTEAQYQEVDDRDLEVVRFENGFFEQLYVYRTEDEEPDDWDAEENGEFEPTVTWETEWIRV